MIVVLLMLMLLRVVHVLTTAIADAVDAVVVVVVDVVVVAAGRIVAIVFALLKELGPNRADRVFVLFSVARPQYLLLLDAVS
uniref:Secreted protein n=1 Tax=Anopheles darlingi TaxID=43151 RepID=A0A2M4D7R5_ANODA